MDEKEIHSELEQALGTTTLPLFPLRLVLFPGQILPLHVFEHRYRLMINQCVEQRKPFGVVLMREDMPDWREFTGEVSLPYDVGTTAHVRRVEKLPDGRMNIVTLGRHRFRVQRLLFDMPFLRAVVEGYPLQTAADAGTEASADGLRQLLHRYMHQLSKVMDAEIDGDDLPDDARGLALLAASALQISWEDKQELLGTPDLPSLIDAERQLLSVETPMLRFMHATEKELEESVFGPTGMLYQN